jgi:4-oxalocrotonate tautomerase
MPFIKIEAGKMNKDLKTKLISDVTKVASETLGIGEEHFTVLIKENDLDNWGIGGKMLSDMLANKGS